MAALPSHPPVVLFGDNASPFTNKVRLALRLKAVPFSYVPVPPHNPILSQSFALSYHQTPVLAIGREIYCDTALIIEALECFFPASAGYGTVYPTFEGLLDEWSYKALASGFSSFWADPPQSPLYRPATFSYPSASDRLQLTSHDITTLHHTANLHLHLDLLERNFSLQTYRAAWAIPTPTPSLADISLYAQLRWALDMAVLPNDSFSSEAQTVHVFTPDAYPGVWSWFHAFEDHIASRPDVSTALDASDAASWKTALRASTLMPDDVLLVPACADTALDCGAQERDVVRGKNGQRGLVPGVCVAVAPDDMGRGEEPTVGTLVQWGREEVVVRTTERGDVDVRLHFPRLGFTVKVVEGSRL